MFIKEISDIAILSSRVFLLIFPLNQLATTVSETFALSLSACATQSPRQSFSGKKTKNSFKMRLQQHEMIKGRNRVITKQSYSCENSRTFLGEIRGRSKVIMKLRVFFGFPFSMMIIRESLSLFSLPPTILLCRLFFWKREKSLQPCVG